MKRVRWSRPRARWALIFYRPGKTLAIFGSTHGSSVSRNWTQAEVESFCKAFNIKDMRHNDRS